MFCMDVGSLFRDYKKTRISREEKERSSRKNPGAIDNKEKWAQTQKERRYLRE